MRWQSLGLTGTAYANRPARRAQRLLGLRRLAARGMRLRRPAVAHHAQAAASAHEQSTIESGTNRLLGSDVDVLGGKTGFIRKAGCASDTRADSQGPQLSVVVLGATTSAFASRSTPPVQLVVARTQGLDGGIAPNPGSRHGALSSRPRIRFPAQRLLTGRCDYGRARAAAGLVHTPRGPPSLRVLMVASEVAPFSRQGTGDVMGGLPALAERHDVRSCTRASRQ
jgi:hypothetical protein